MRAEQSEQSDYNKCLVARRSVLLPPERGGQGRPPGPHGLRCPERKADSGMSAEELGMQVDDVALLDRAYMMAKYWHRHQKRKYTGQPYLVHLVNVAYLLQCDGQPKHVVAAGLLHDCKEDQGIEHETLVRHFGQKIAMLVDGMTDRSKPSDGNRARRKEIDRMHLAVGCPEVHTIKLSDIIDNGRDIARHDPKFARVYHQEMRLLLPFLADGSPSLYEKADCLLKEHENG